MKAPILLLLLVFLTQLACTETGQTEDGVSGDRPTDQVSDSAGYDGGSEVSGLELRSQDSTVSDTGGEDSTAEIDTGDDPVPEGALAAVKLTITSETDVMIYEIAKGTIKTTKPTGICQDTISSSSLEYIDGQTIQVDWDNVQASYIDAENPSCCCDQRKFELHVELDFAGAPPTVDTEWCEADALAGDIPDLLNGFAWMTISYGDEMPCN